MSRRVDNHGAMRACLTTITTTTLALATLAILAMLSIAVVDIAIAELTHGKPFGLVNNSACRTKQDKASSIVNKMILCLNYTSLLKSRSLESRFPYDSKSNLTIYKPSNIAFYIMYVLKASGDIHGADCSAHDAHGTFDDADPCV
jgi:hypothetical protein